MNEPSLDALIQTASKTDFDVFGHAAEAQKNRAAYTLEMDQKSRDVAFKAAHIFGSDAGRDVLEHLLDITLRRASFVAHLGLPIDQAYGFGVFREGQNAIVFTLLKLIALGQKNEMPKPRE